MKKSLIFCILIVSVILISGCTSDEKKNTETSSDTNTHQEEKSLMDLEKFIDPQLKNVLINSPDIEVVRFELDDNREYEDDENYILRILVSNNGDKPVWIALPRVYYEGQTHPILASGVGHSLFLLQSGKRAWFSISCKTTSYADSRLKKLSSLVIYSHVTIIPTISPELKSLSFSSTRCRSIYNCQGSNLFPFDIHSIEYEEEEAGWKYIIVGMSSNVSNHGCVFNAYLSLDKFSINSETTVERRFSRDNSGKIEYMKIPIPKSWTIQQIGAIQEIYINIQ